MSDAARTLSVPAIDIGPFLDGDPKEKQAVASAVAAACRDIGFLVIENHGLAQNTLDTAFRLSREFFDLPQPEKDAVHPTGPSKQRGYHGFASRGLANTLGIAAPPDLRESVFLGPIDDYRSAFTHIPEAELSYWPNTVPTRPDGVADALIALYRVFENLSGDLLRIFALALDMPEEHFADKIDKHFSIMSCHHYPALTEPPAPGQLRTGPHTDFGALTILAMTTEKGGLEVQMPDGSWAGVVAGPGELVVNLGDMMARWTNDRWKSTLHRVANPPELSDAMSRRQSIGYFMHPNFDAPIECFPTCRTEGQTPLYPTITAGAHIAEKIAKSHAV